MSKKLSKTTYMQILFVGLVILISTIALMFIGFIISTLLYGFDATVGAFQGNINSIDEIAIFKLLQFFNQLSVFILPVLALVWYIRKDSPQFICFNRVPDISQFFAVIILFIASIPLIQYTMELNSQMQLPAFMHGLQEWMREKEDLAKIITDKFMNTKEISSYFANLLIIAIMPAIGEELVFRGLLTRWIAKLTSNIHLNIIITSIIFSAFHLQFFGFIPRFLLGMLLGYTYYFTQSIWASMLFHFINNALTVTIYFYIYKNDMTINPEDVGTVDNPLIVIVSIIAIIGIFFWFKKQIPQRKCLE